VPLSQADPLSLTDEVRAIATFLAELMIVGALIALAAKRSTRRRRVVASGTILALIFFGVELFCYDVYVAPLWYETRRLNGCNHVAGDPAHVTTWVDARVLCIHARSRIFHVERLSLIFVTKLELPSVGSPYWGGPFDSLPHNDLSRGIVVFRGRDLTGTRRIFVFHSGRFEETHAPFFDELWMRDLVCHHDPLDNHSVEPWDTLCRLDRSKWDDSWRRFIEEQ
jgi:hypothetical protein